MITNAELEQMQDSGSDLISYSL